MIAPTTHSPRLAFVVRMAVVLVGVGAMAALLEGGVWYETYLHTPLVELLHVPQVYGRRSGQLTANVSGRLSPRARDAAYRLNDGPWRPIPRDHDRIIPPLFTLELGTPDIRPGLNRLQVRASANAHPTETVERAFRYDPRPVLLPHTVDFGQAELEAQDGYFERVFSGGEWRVRPVPGYEGYDRILLVSGAFPAPRRIETDVVYRRGVPGAREQGFGILSLWGGHPDDATVRPRRGWSFALAWYWTKPGGAGNEMSYKYGAGQPSWVNGYESMPLAPGSHYRLIVEVEDVRSAGGRHLAYVQRLKWWRSGTPQPVEWLRTSDVPGSPLPEGEYGVALLAYNCQVEFGPVHISALGPPATPFLSNLPGGARWTR